MRKLVIVFFVMACAKQQPAPVPPASGPMSPEECTQKGGYVKGDIGDGKVACTDGEQDLGRVNQGIEGAVCCMGK